MKLIIPMAGRGKRMRPHTLVTPKPLLKIAGKSLVQRIVEDLKNSANTEFNEIHFVIGDFGREVENELVEIAGRVGAKGYIHVQEEPLGTAHAVYAAGDALRGEVIVAFADTLFEGNFAVDIPGDAIIWTMRVKNPENYGVVITGDERRITGFSEKPEIFISDEAIVGIYFFRKGELLKEKIETLFANGLIVKGEYQLTDALDLLLKDEVIIVSANIEKWLDCGNKREFLRSAKNILERESQVIERDTGTNTIILPVYLGKNVVIKDSIIGPYVVIEDNTKLISSKIDNSIVYADCEINNSKITESIIGSNSLLVNAEGVLNVGDFSTYENN